MISARELRAFLKFLDEQIDSTEDLDKLKEISVAAYMIDRKAQEKIIRIKEKLGID